MTRLTRFTAFGAGNYNLALQCYVAGMSKLCPFISDASIMTFEQSHQVGLHQM